MIKLKDKEKINYEKDLDEAKIEEALAKWELAKPSETSQDDEARQIGNHHASNNW